MIHSDSPNYMRDDKNPKKSCMIQESKICEPKFQMETTFKEQHMSLYIHQLSKMQYL
jgi:hypothetical protein